VGSKQKQNKTCRVYACDRRQYACTGYSGRRYVTHTSAVAQRADTLTVLSAASDKFAAVMATIGRGDLHSHLSGPEIRQPNSARSSALCARCPRTGLSFLRRHTRRAIWVRGSSQGHRGRHFGDLNGTWLAHVASAVAAHHPTLWPDRHPDQLRGAIAPTDSLDRRHKTASPANARSRHASTNQKWICTRDEASSGGGLSNPARVCMLAG